jgi:hypothetical protein
MNFSVSQTTTLITFYKLIIVMSQIEEIKTWVENEFILEESIHESTNKAESFFFTVDKDKYPDAIERVKQKVEEFNSSGWINKDLELIQSTEGGDYYYFTIFYGSKGFIGKRSGGRNSMSFPPKIPKNRDDS